MAFRTHGMTQMDYLLIRASVLGAVKPTPQNGSLQLYGNMVFKKKIYFIVFWVLFRYWIILFYCVDILF